MKSMNGYGRGEASNGEISIVVEVRCNAHRSKDVQIRLPKFYLSLEPRIKTTISEHITRGRVDVYINRNQLRSMKMIHCDLELAQQYYDAIQQLSDSLGRESSEISLKDVYSQPGVLIQKEKTADALNEWFVLSTALDLALSDAIAQRSKEGLELQEEIHRLGQALHSEVKDLCAQQDAINRKLFLRLEKRLQRLLGDQLNSKRLTQEAAFLVEKSDCSDELSRLDGHCQKLLSLQDTQTEHKAIGRKLDFVLQEINRELNTIGSKIQEYAFAKIIVEAKSHADSLRELVSDIE